MHQTSKSKTIRRLEKFTPHPHKEKQNKTNTYKAIVINGEDVLLLGHQEPKASTGRVLEGDTTSLGAQNPVHIVPIVELVVEPIWDVDHLGGITILNNDEVVWLQEWPPHLQEIQVPDRGDHYV